MLEVLFFVFTCLVKVIISVSLFVIVFTIAWRIFIEPKKGTCKCTTRLDNKVALITGGNSGIGLETARDLASRGARVIIASSNEQKSKIAVEDIKSTTGNPNVEYKHLDLSKFKSIRDFTEDFNKTVDRLDILVNNAGFVGADKITEDGMNNVMQINHLGPFLLTSLLLEKLIKCKPSRIVIVSSCIHLASYFDDNDLAGLNNLYLNILFKYANSKLCNVLWTKALSKRLPRGVTVNCLHPGPVKTNLFNHFYPIFENIILAIMNILFKNPKEGAQTTIHLCVSPDLDNISGEYFVDCKITSPSKKAKNNDLVEKVWNNSVELTKYE
ncbi:retinol dehydrogenase 12-like [Amyelois transitella]|uniref:retinol dehydrogenase 12-like n=1 Tax=Amyelois transitella TaxID=680683 RepID=UPI00298FAC25|nr:retinol dehydrogenase 12-like [Amyelois transitella]